MAQNALDVPLAVKHAQDLERAGFRMVDNDVVGVTRQGPEPNWQLCEIGPDVALKRVPGKSFAGGKDRFLDSIGCCAVISCDKLPNVVAVRDCIRCEPEGGYYPCFRRSDRRSSRLQKTSSPSINSPRSA